MCAYCGMSDRFFALFRGKGGILLTDKFVVTHVYSIAVKNMA